LNTGEAAFFSGAHRRFVTDRNTGRKRDLRDFAKKWDHNLNEQGFLRDV
jgi:hypothetical protein